MMQKIKTANEDKEKSEQHLSPNCKSSSSNVLQYCLNYAFLKDFKNILIIKKTYCSNVLTLCDLDVIILHGGKIFSIFKKI